MGINQNLSQLCPKRIKIVPDDDHAEWVGKTSNGMQFFDTNPFDPAWPAKNHRDCEFIAVFLWNLDGSFNETRIDNLGPRSQLDHNKVNQIFENRIKELGEYKIMAINIEPFEMERVSRKEFGLVYFHSLAEKWCSPQNLQMKVWS